MKKHYFYSMTLVTGGTGLVGSHLLFKLVTESNTKVRAIYRNKNSLQTVKKVFGYYHKTPEILFGKIEWIKADILDIPALTIAFAHINKVYHCAGLISFNPKKYKLLRKTNIEGTANIVNLCIANGIKKLCYVSSIATLGTTINKPITENTYWSSENHNSEYAISKYGAELEVWRGAQEGVLAVIVNPGVIIGPGFWETGSGTLFKKVFKDLNYYTQGSTGYIAINDVVHIMVKLMQSEISNEQFILVSKNLSYKKLLTLLASALHVTIPNKKASGLFLNLIWRLDWFKTTVFGGDRLLTKQLSLTLQQKATYSNAKIIKALGDCFTSLQETIKFTAKQFLKENG